MHLCLTADGVTVRYQESSPLCFPPVPGTGKDGRHHRHLRRPVSEFQMRRQWGEGGERVNYPRMNGGTFRTHVGGVAPGARRDAAGPAFVSGARSAPIRFCQPL